MSQNDFGELEDPFAMQDNLGGNNSDNESQNGDQIEDNFIEEKLPQISKPQSRQSIRSYKDSEQDRAEVSVRSRKSALPQDRNEKLQRYLSSLSDYDKSRYQQLSEKNVKLRKELKGISKATEEIIRKEKERKRQKYHHREDSEVKRKQRVLREQQGHLNSLKKKITSKKRELDTAYQYPLIREKEDELRNLKRILQELTIERDSVLKVKKSQTRALNGLKYNKEEEGRKQQLAQELAKIKKENKSLTEKKMELEKLMNKNHTKIVNGKVYIRELKKRLIDFKKNNDGVDYKKITPEDVTELKEKIKKLETDKKSMETRHIHDLKNIERMKHELRSENARLDKLLSEKDKEMRLNSIKMKELKRLQRHRALKPVKEKVEIGMHDSHAMKDHGIDAQSHGNDEFEFVDDKKNDTKINISQEDENFIKGEDSSRNSENSEKLDNKIIPDEPSVHSEHQEEPEQSEQIIEKSRSISRKQSNADLDIELGQDLNMNGIDDKEEMRLPSNMSSKQNTNNDGFGGLNLPKKNDKLDDPFGGNDTNNDDIFGGNKSNKKPTKKLNDPFGGDDDDLLVTKPKVKDDMFDFGGDGDGKDKQDDDPFGFGGLDDENDDPFGGGGGKKKVDGLNLDFIGGGDDDF